MSAVTHVIREEQEQERRLQESIAKALDFSEAYESLERAEKKLEEAKKLLPKP
jgi:hypothetical protein